MPGGAWGVVTRRCTRRVLAPAMLMLGGSCGGDPDPSAEQARLGADLYQARCAVCHEQEPAIGTRLDAPTLRSYRSARALYDYTSFAMPYDAPRSMSPDQYWAVTAHMLRSRGLLEPGTRLGPASADAVHWNANEP